MEVTAGTLLGGRVGYLQPVLGYRTGIEPVFLAACVPARPGERVLELGTGAGAALLCLLTRVPGVIATGVERDHGMAGLARRNAAGLPGVTIHTGTAESFDEPGAFDHSCANPPWHDPAGTLPHDPARRAALHGDAAARWIRVLRRSVRTGGTITLVLAARLSALAVESLGRDGRTIVRPFVPKAGRAAKIVLVHHVTGGSAPVEERPGLVLHEADGRYSAAAESVLREGAGLSWEE